MKLVTFRVQTPVGWADRLGAIAGEVVVDLNQTYAWYLHQQGDAQPEIMAATLLPSNMQCFLERGARAMENARLVVELYKHGECHLDTRGVRDSQLIFPLDTVTLLAPLPKPVSLRDFYVFEQHVKTGFDRRQEPMPKEWYEMPVYYQSNRLSMLGPDVTIPWPSYTKKLDYELELACIIGKAGKNIPIEQAGQHIAGYMILNDFSARDIQKKEMACRLGPAKGKGFASASGPWLVTPDEVGNAHQLEMTAHINGKEWSRGNSSTANYTFAQMIAHASKEEMLYPGEIIGSGTVGTGCGLELDRWIQPGDTVTLAIDKLGQLTNTIGK
jgi:2-keto-4-pentenoate hydratase/2-oxohepta-3-ene-1,7-dioic acid hydratase in catechol pathway